MTIGSTMIALADIAREAVYGTVATILGFTVAWFYGFVAALDNEKAAMWYEQPAVAAALVAGVFMLSVHAYNWYRDGRKQAREDEEEHDKTQVDLRKLTNEEWQQMIARADALQARELESLRDAHRRDTEFLQTELLQKEIEAYRQREISHVAFNALNKSYGHIRVLERTMVQCQLPVPVFDFVYQDEVARSVQDSVNAYKQQIRNNARAVSGAPDSTENPNA